MLKVIDFMIWITQGAAPSHEVMIATDRVEPRLVEPGKHLLRLRPPIDQVPYGKQSIRAFRKPNGIQCLLQRAETTMNVADGEIPSSSVLSIMDDAGIHYLRRWVILV